MEQKKRKYWFKRKRYGFGWVPSTYQGWFATLLYVVAIVYAAKRFAVSQPDLFAFLAVLITFCFIMLTYFKGPTPKWRWGKDVFDNPDEDV